MERQIPDISIFLEGRSAEWLNGFWNGFQLALKLVDQEIQDRLGELRRREAAAQERGHN